MLTLLFTAMIVGNIGASHAEAQLSVSTLLLGGHEVVFYDNVERNDLLLIWLHGGIMHTYDNPLNDELAGSSNHFQDNQARAFALAGIDVLEPLSFTMTWVDRGQWVLNIVSSFNPAAKGYRMIVLGGNSGGGTVVANVITHNASQASAMFNRAVLVSPAVDFQDDGIFGAIKYADKVRVNSTLGIHGTADTVVPPTQSTHFFAALPTFIYTDLRFIDGATHVTIMGYATPLIIAFIVPPKIDTELSLFSDATTVNATAGEKINMFAVIVAMPDKIGLAGIAIKIEYYIPDNSSWITLTTLFSDQTGQASYAYLPTASGLPYTVELRAIYTGNATFNRSTSAIHAVNVIPEFAVFAPLTLLAAVGLLLLFKRRNEGDERT